MKFEEVCARLNEREREEDKGVYTNPDAVFYLLSLRNLDLADLSKISGIPLCTIVKLPNRPTKVRLAEAEGLALALDCAIAAFTLGEPPRNCDTTVSYELLEALSNRIRNSADKEEPLALRFG